MIIINNGKDQVTAGKVVSVHYTLTNDEGDVIDSSQGGQPLAYLHGHGNLVPGFEKALVGKSKGEQVKFDVPPEEGYGVRDEEGVQAVQRAAFPPDMDLQRGMQFAVQGPQGEVVPMWISGFQDDMVLVDLNHPLAGMTLHFDVQIVDIRDATREEMAHGHPHGPGGHHH